MRCGRDTLWLGTTVRALIAALCSLLLAARALADEAGPIEIPAGDLTTAIESLARTAGIEIVYRSKQLKGLRTAGVNGVFTAREAVAKLLEGTPVTVVVDDSGAMILVVDQRGTPSSRSSSDEPRRQVRAAGESARDDRSSGDALARLPDPSIDLLAVEPADVEEIVVTGSRIARSQLEASVQLTSLSRVELLEAGHLSLAEALVEVPGIEYDASPTNSQTATHASGLSTISLRNLDSNRTLVLIDGQRTVSNSVTATRVSLDTIPADLIERVEVITGGASAVYGSDAVAGVVNIITQSDFEGVRSSARAAELSDGGNTERALSLTAGGRFAADRAYALVSMSWDEQGGLRSDERGWAMRPLVFDAQNNRLIDPGLSSATPGGRYLGRRFYFDEAGLQRDFETASDGFNERPFGTLIIPRERFLAGGKLDLSVTDSVSAFAQVQFASVKTNAPRRPDDIASSDLSLVASAGAPFNGRIPLNNPFVPAAIRAEALALGRSDIDFERRLVELGLQGRRNDRRTSRAWMGLKGTYADAWQWQAAYSYGRFDFEQARTNGVQLSHLRNALDVEADPMNPTAFRCRDAAARTQGCVPIDLFGVGSIDDDAAAYIRTSARLAGTLRQDVASASATGTLPGLRAGPVRVALGAEYRREQETVTPDPVSESGDTSLAPIPTIDGGFHVAEAFAEAVVPLLRERRLVHDLGIEAAVRLANYSQPNVDRVSSFKVGGSWAPTADVRVRGQFARAQRAPDIAELFSPARGDFEDVDDPCNAVTAVTPGVIAQNCRAVPAIAASISDTGRFTQRSRNVFAPNVGNLNLSEETADTVTAGIVFTPRIAPRLTASVDYYRIEIEDGIGSIDSQVMLDQCYQAAARFPGNRFCDAITRAADGQIAQILNQAQNLNRLVSSGIDTSVRYSLDLLDAANLPGMFDISLLHTHILRLQDSFAGVDGGSVIDEGRGEIGNFTNRWRATLGWSHGGWRARWRAQYFSAALDSHDRAEFFARRGIADPLFLRVPSYVTHDVYVHYEFGAGPRVRLALGANNIFDEIGPLLPSGTDSGGSSNFNGVYDIGGRLLYGQVHVTF